MDEDEFDAYNVDFDVDHLPYITDLPPSPTVATTAAPTRPLADVYREDSDAAVLQALSRPDTPVSEFAEYDLSEFTAEDLDALDPPPVKHGAETHGPSAAPRDEGFSASLVPRRDANGRLASASGSRTLLGQVSGGPAIDIELEQSTSMAVEDEDTVVICKPNVSSKKDGKRKAQDVTAFRAPREPLASHMRSLSNMFRSRGVFSVTDLVGPVWCEYQFEYGLRQRRYKKIEDRPTSFVSAQGKLIEVDKVAALDNEQRLERGKTIHKKLELEVHPEEVVVEIASPEERWALRLVRLINCLHSLMTSGLCREMPVFGFVHGEAVIGVIDEVTRVPVSPKPPPSPSLPIIERKRDRSALSAQNTPTKSRPTKIQKNESSSSVQSTLDAFISVPSPGPSKVSPVASEDGRDAVAGVVVTQCAPSPQKIAAPSEPSFRLHISDTKTRQYPTMPLAEDTLSTRLQLMLYRRLLSGLLASPPSFSFEEFNAKQRLSRTRPFSAKFLADTQLSVDLNSLARLDEALQFSLSMLNVSGVDEVMTVEYRLQQQPGRSRKWKHEVELSASDQEKEDIAKAIAASLIDQASQVHNAEISEANPELFESTNPTAQAAFSDAPFGQPGITNGGYNFAESLVPTDIAHFEQGSSGDKLAQLIVSDLSGSDSEPEVGLPSGIIGTKKIRHDDAFLDAHLDDVLQFWHGQRSARGVDIDLTRRCRTCEYSEGCEWREQKAEEIVARAQEKNGEVAT